MDDQLISRAGGESAIGRDRGSTAGPPVMGGSAVYPRTGSQLAFARVATAFAAFSVAALAVGALAVGFLTIRRLAIGSGSIRRLSIGDLEVARLHVGELISEPDASRRRG